MRQVEAVHIREVVDARGRSDWLEVPSNVFRGDPSWIRPLNVAELERISPRHNPLFTFGEAAFFIAYRGEKPVGRISAQINRRHLEHRRDGAGHFGFFDCINDVEVARVLVEAASDWLKSRGLAVMQGPFNLTINEDTGLLIAGFDTPPAVLSSHAAPWAGELLEQCGLVKAVDLLAYRMGKGEPPRELSRLARLARQSGRVRLRNFDMSRYDAEVALVFDIFNDAWRDNWGFVPVGEAEVAALARDTRAVMRSKFGWIAEVDGEPSAMLVVLPDINRVIAPFNGRLLPFNWARLAWAIWRDRWKSARIPLLGVRKQYQGTPLSTALLSLLLAEVLELAEGYDLDWVEFSWVLESNRPMIQLAELAAGPAVKTYRVYEKVLSS